MGLEALLPLGRFLPSISSTLDGDFEVEPEASGVRSRSSLIAAACVDDTQNACRLGDYT